MKQLILVPNAWVCSYAECPPGFFVNSGQLCFKSEYSEDGRPVGYNSEGEFYCGETGRTEMGRGRVLDD